VTARRIIAKGCIHPPKPSEPRPLAASVRVFRSPAPPRQAAAAERPLADTAPMRWATADE
jgi:hypothetical protein